MADSIYLRLAAPLQSWALGRVTGNSVQSEPRPTFSGVQGLIAASMGWPRGAWEPWISQISLTIRSDQLGHRHEEFQTINPRTEDLVYQERIYRLLTGKNWSNRTHFTPDGQNKTSIVRRTYLADAAFLIEIRGPHITEISSALVRPAFTQYLGRKAFAPTFPFILGTGPAGLLKTLPTWDKRESPADNIIYDEWFNASETPGPDPQLRVDHHPSAEGEAWVNFTQVKSLPWIHWLETLSGQLSTPTKAD